jgi:hypothetical protein
VQRLEDRDDVVPAREPGIGGVGVVEGDAILDPAPRQQP